MTEEVRNQMSEEISSSLEKLQGLELGSKEYLTAVEAIGKLYEAGTRDLVEDAKYDEMIARREMDEEHHQQDLEEKRKDRKWRLLEAAASLILPLGVYIWAFGTGMEFEETGTISSPWVRQLVDGIKPTKKK